MILHGIDGRSLESVIFPLKSGNWSTEGISNREKSWNFMLWNVEKKSGIPVLYRDRGRSFLLMFLLLFIFFFKLFFYVFFFFCWICCCCCCCCCLFCFVLFCIFYDLEWICRHDTYMTLRNKNISEKWFFRIKKKTNKTTQIQKKKQTNKQTKNKQNKEKNI